MSRKKQKSKAARGVRTVVIKYRDRDSGPYGRKGALKVDVPRTQVLDTEQAAALVTLKTPLALSRVSIVSIEEA